MEDTAKVNLTINLHVFGTESSPSLACLYSKLRLFSHAGTYIYTLVPLVIEKDHRQLLMESAHHSWWTVYIRGTLSKLTKI